MTGWYSQVVEARLFAAVFTVLLLGAVPQFVKAETRNLPRTVRVTPIERDGQILNLVEVGELPSFALEDPSENERGLNREQRQKLAEVRRDILRKTLIGLVSVRSESPVLVSDQSVTTIGTKTAPSQVDVIDQFQKVVHSRDWTGDTKRDLVGLRNLRVRATAIVAFVWEAVVRSTIVSGKEFYNDGKTTKGAREFGFSTVIRGEFQVGMGNINMMKTVARGLNVGYDFATKELVIRRVVRTESMSGGVALSTGPKIEIQGYRASLDAQERMEKGHHIHGQSWYPPAIPGLSFAAEKFPGFSSVGLLLSGNVFEWFMPFLPLYAANTVNQFDAEYSLRRISLRPSSAVHFTVNKVKSWMSERGLIRRSINSCVAIF